MQTPRITALFLFEMLRAERGHWNKLSIVDLIDANLLFEPEWNGRPGDRIEEGDGAKALSVYERALERADKDAEDHMYWNHSRLVPKITEYTLPSFEGPRVGLSFSLDYESCTARTLCMIRSDRASHAEMSLYRAPGAELPDEHAEPALFAIWYWSVQCSGDERTQRADAMCAALRAIVQSVRDEIAQYHPDMNDWYVCDRAYRLVARFVLAAITREERIWWDDDKEEHYALTDAFYRACVEGEDAVDAFLAKHVYPRVTR